MAHVEGEIVISRPPGEVFDYVADERNEPRYNRQMSRVELLTAEPIGAGSRFKAEMSMLGRPVDMIVELTRYDRPRLLASRSESSTRNGHGRPMVTEGALTFEPVPEGTRMRWAWEIETAGIPAALAPLVGLLGRRQERRIWSALKRLLES